MFVLNHMETNSLVWISSLPFLLFRIKEISEIDLLFLYHILFLGTATTIQRRSAPISAQFSTKESEPGALTSFHPYGVEPSRINFQWELPEANGIIVGFVIEYQPETLQSVDTAKSFAFGKDFLSSDRKGTIENLTPGVKYVFRIKANTRVGSGPWVSFLFQYSLFLFTIVEQILRF